MGKEQYLALVIAPVPEKSPKKHVHEFPSKLPADVQTNIVKLC